MDESYPDDVVIQLLGPLRLWRGGRDVETGPPQRRAILAVLALAGGHPVGRDALVDTLWPDAPPRRATNVIQTHVKHLRRTLEPGRRERAASRLLPSIGTGYALRLSPTAVDAARFCSLVAEAGAAYRRGDQTRVWQLSEEAGRLWRPPLADVPFLAEHPRVVALTVAWRQLSTWRFDVGVRQGRAEEVLPELREHAARWSLDEPLHAQLIRCYLAMGRRSEAFVTYARVRARLAAELGVDPGPVLSRVHRELLDPVDAAEPVVCPVRPAQLPPEPVAFTGRAAYLDLLDRIGLGPQGRRPAVVVLTGTAGVGKTALAVRWGHRAAARFPDGQLYADLRGMAPGGPASPPAEVLRDFLHALGVARERIPDGPAARVGLYRSLLSGRRVLVVLDNARDAEQVRLLLPSVSGSVAVVTSRNQMSGLVASDGAHPVCLDLLSPVEARDLVVARVGPDRVAAEPAALHRIVAACAGLPLALSSVAARAARHPSFPLAVLADDLRGSLHAFHDDDPVSDVRTVFSWSYRDLTTEAARLFRLLGWHGGGDVSVPAAARMTGLPEEQARVLLAELCRASLLTEHAPHRFTCHGLLRSYARELASPPGGRSAA